MFGQADNGVQSMSYDLDDVQASGELIAATLSGPDTYYEYRGQGFGLQFAMAEAFANRMGARLRMEMASDTAQLIAKLSAGDVDLIALELDSTLSNASLRLMPNGWGVRANSSQLASAIVKWWNPDIRQQLLATEQSNKMAANRVRRHMQPALLSRSTGTISRYDAHFIRAAQRIGWDWRLLAAQCYQESGFDPQAVSWAGACGLMQIMPSTGERLGLSRDDLFDPSRNIEAAARYISQLNSTFSAFVKRIIHNKSYASLFTMLSKKVNFFFGICGIAIKAYYNRLAKALDILDMAIHILHAFLQPFHIGLLNLVNWHTTMHL